MSIKTMLFVGLSCVSFFGCGMDAAPSGDCKLNTVAALLPADTPFGKAVDMRSDIVYVRNKDGDHWRGVTITIYGFVGIGTDRKPTGPYVLEYSQFNAGHTYSLQLKDFEKTKSGGERWVSTTMRPEEMEIVAKINGRSCKAEVTLQQHDWKS
jgi:hypothetical protein